MGDFLKKYCERHSIVLHKGENLHIFLTLVLNWVLHFKLHLYKWLCGIHRPIVHYYAVCWNEEKMLPFMFDYYRQFVDHFTIYDNYSDDSSEAIINSHRRAKVIKFKSDGFNDTIHQQIKDNCWKRSRGKADFVIVCDIDEFLYHPDMEAFLADSLKKHYSIFRTSGYDMYSQEYPKYERGVLLTDIEKNGVRAERYDKPILFDPHRIVKIQYEVGAHKAYPKGVVRRRESQDELKLLHYKNLSLDYVLGRAAIYAERLSKVNKENHWGTHYLEKEARIRKEFCQNLAQSKPVIP